MPRPPENSSEAGLLLRAVTTAEYVLGLIDQVEEEVDQLASLHWYGDLPDTQDLREILADDIKSHKAALGRWNGDVVSVSLPSPRSGNGSIEDVNLPSPLNLQKSSSEPKD